MKVGRRWHMNLGNSSNLTPEQLIREFRKTMGPFGWVRGYDALDKFIEVDNKTTFFEPTIQFVEQEDEDKIRSWGTSVLEQMKDKEAEGAFKFLVTLLKKEKTKEQKRRYIHTRFFSLKAIKTLADSDNRKTVLFALLKDLWKDKEEDYFTQAGASVLLALDERSDGKTRKKAIAKIRDMLSNRLEFWPVLRALRALREFPLEDVVDEILQVRRDSQYVEHKRYAILALAGYGESEKALEIVRELGLIVRTDPDSYLRLAAVHSLGDLGHLEAQDDLLEALNDEDAEVREQAGEALEYLLEDSAVRAIVQYALRKGVENEKRTRLIEALRRIDPDRTLSTEVLNKELDSEDRERAQVADEILVELGGWKAIQRVSQRRKTLEALRQNLEESEKAVTDAFKNTMRQAHRNFDFAMGINTIIVGVGICLIALAMAQLILMPEKLESWIVPGSTGVLGIIVSFYFNNSRKNAREDLTTLVNVAVIFQGFLERLKEIDATFEKSYIESQFRIEDMETTVEQIDQAVTKTLSLAPLICSPTRETISESRVLDFLRSKESGDNKDHQKKGTRAPV